MRRLVPGIGCAVILVNAAACSLGWKHDGGALVLPESHSHVASGRTAPPGDDPAVPSAAKEIAAPGRMSLTLPGGWNWVMRGDDFVATKDGVFLQNIVIERIHVDQTSQSRGAFPLAALSSKQWPVRTVVNLKKRFARGMSAGEAADVLLESRKNDPSVAGLEVREVSMRTVAGTAAFRAVFEFRLKTGGPSGGAPRLPLYRSVYCGFMRDDWFYGIEYTAAARHYFPKDAEPFEAVLRSVALADR